MASDVISDSAGGALWALVTLLILMIVLGLLYFGGAFKSNQEIDTDINKPGVFFVVP